MKLIQSGPLSRSEVINLGPMPTQRLHALAEALRRMGYKVRLPLRHTPQADGDSNER